MHNIINIAERVGEGSWQKWKQDFEEGPLKFSCGLDVTHCDAFHFALMFVLNVRDGRLKVTKILSRREWQSHHHRLLANIQHLAMDSYVHVVDSSS